jgi:hypothetical protein
MKTAIPVLYRDRDNYKIHGCLVAYGAITDSDREKLKASLHNEERYLPLQLGLDYYGTDWSSYDPDDCDHPWHEMGVGDIEVAEDGKLRLPGQHVEHVGAVDAFARRVAAASSVGWDSKRYCPDAS